MAARAGPVKFYREKIWLFTNTNLQILARMPFPEISNELICRSAVAT